MTVKGCEKLTAANVIIVYELSSEKANVKTKFHDELYGRKKEGLLFRIPHRKLARGVIEISQRNLGDVRSVFEKYGVGYELRLTFSERDPDQIVKIAKTINDPYEKAQRFDSVHFSEFVTEKLERIGKEHLESDDLLDELLAINDTIEKWVKTHQEEPLATGFAYMFKGLETAIGKAPEEIKRDTLRIAETLRHWAVGYQVIEESKDTDSIDDVLKKYRQTKSKR